MKKEPCIEIRFKEGKIEPKDISVSELLDALKAIEKAIAAFVLREHPEVKSEELFVGLIGVSKGSASYRFAPSRLEYSLPASRSVFGATARNELATIPRESAEAMLQVSRFAQKRNCVTEFTVLENGGSEVVELMPTTILSLPKSKPIEGTTTMYAYVERVGGVTPIVSIRIGNSRLSSETTAAIAKELGRRLYEWVGLRGTARWDAETYNLKDFIIKEVTEYQDTPMTEAIAELRGLIGKYWQDVDDVVRELADIRGSATHETD
jgi:hypothetical protein